MSFTYSALREIDNSTKLLSQNQTIMKAIFLLLCLSFGIGAHAQFETKAKADAQKYFPGYSSYVYSHKKQKIEGLRYYYRCNVDGFKSAGFKCYPTAKLRKGLWVEYWSNGALKDKGTWLGTRYMDVPNPNRAALTKALESSFKPVEFFDGAWLWNLLEIHSFEISADMTGKNEPYWESEQDVLVYGSVTASIIQGCCDVKKYKFEGVFKFKSSDCGKTFTFVDGYQKPSMYNKELLEEKSVSQEEGIQLQKKTIGRAAAEDKAKEEWDALVDLDMPKFEHVQEFSAYVYQVLASGTEEEVKSIVYRTLPSYKFMEGSKYLLDWSAQNYVEKVIDQVIGNNGVNVQTNFCPVINRYKNAKNSYKFHDKAEQKTLEIRTTKENGEYKVKEFVIWLAEGLKDKECPEMIQYEDVSYADFGFSIKMPKGYKETKTDKSVVLEHKINGIKYVVAVSNFGDGESNDSRERQAKDNVDRHILDIQSGYEEISDWSINGVTGKEAFFLAQNSKYERYRTIYLGDYNYEFWIIGLSFTETDDVFFDSFKSDNKGGGSREGLSFELGDPVEMHIGAGRWESGTITEVNSDGTYGVSVPNTGKSYTAPIDALRADPNGKKADVGKTTDADVNFKVGDNVLVRVSQTDWEPATVEEVKSDGKYRVKMTDSGDQYIQPKKNLKPNPNAKKTSLKDKMGKFKIR